MINLIDILSNPIDLVFTIIMFALFFTHVLREEDFKGAILGVAFIGALWHILVTLQAGEITFETMMASLVTTVWLLLLAALFISILEIVNKQKVKKNLTSNNVIDLLQTMNVSLQQLVELQKTPETSSPSSQYSVALEQTKDLISGDRIHNLQRSFEQSINNLSEKLTAHVSTTQNDQGVEAMLAIVEKLKISMEVLDTQLKRFNQKVQDSTEIYNHFEKAEHSALTTLTQLSQDISKALTTQSETLNRLTTEIEKQLPESLGQLEQTLTALTQKFAQDYTVFLEKLSQLTSEKK